MSVTVETAVEVLPGRRRTRWPLLGRIAAVAVIACVGIAIFGPVIAPYAPGKIVSQTVFGSMTWAHPLGTDYLGRDMLSRVLTGARYTIGVALPATLLASFAGTMLGMLAASLGRRGRSVISRAMDTLISFPSLMFSLVVIAAHGFVRDSADPDSGGDLHARLFPHRPVDRGRHQCNRFRHSGARARRSTT